MSYETVTTTSADGWWVEIRAYGGNRRSRGSKIAAEVRRQARAGVTLKCYHRSYDDPAGFQSMSLAKYKVLAKPASVE